MEKRLVYLTQVLHNPSYTQAARRLMKASRAAGGVECAAQHIEWAARFGTGHLRPANFKHLSGKPRIPFAN